MTFKISQVHIPINFHLFLIRYIFNTTLIFKTRRISDNMYVNESINRSYTTTSYQLYTFDSYSKTTNYFTITSILHSQHTYQKRLHSPFRKKKPHNIWPLTSDIYINWTFPCQTLCVPVSHHKKASTSKATVNSTIWICQLKKTDSWICKIQIIQFVQDNNKSAY